MRVRVLGSAAGGGFPQWNCACTNCRGVRSGEVRASPRTQTSVAVSADEQAWVLLDASPDVARQIEATPALHPRARRQTPIAAVVLTGDDLDRCLGLFQLRERQPLVVYATVRVQQAFSDNTFARTLARFPEQLTWRPLVLGRETPIEGVSGPTGFTVEAIPSPGRPPPHRWFVTPHPEDNVGLVVKDAQSRRLAYVPGAGAITPELRRAVGEAHLVLFDGTFFSEEELLAEKVAPMRAGEMAHLPLAGPRGTLAALAGLRARRAFVHVNNTNPILREDSPERAQVHAAGWEVAHDGLEWVA